MPAANDAWVRSVGLSKIIATVCGPASGFASYGVRLSVGGEGEHLGLLGRAEVVVAQEVPGHDALPSPASRMPGQAARNASASSSVSTSGGASRIRSGSGC